MVKKKENAKWLREKHKTFKGPFYLYELLAKRLL